MRGRPATTAPRPPPPCFFPFFRDLAHHGEGERKIWRERDTRDRGAEQSPITGQSPNHFAEPQRNVVMTVSISAGVSSRGGCGDTPRARDPIAAKPLTLIQPACGKGAIMPLPEGCGRPRRGEAGRGDARQGDRTFGRTLVLCASASIRSYEAKRIHAKTSSATQTRAWQISSARAFPSRLACLFRQPAGRKGGPSSGPPAGPGPSCGLDAGRRN